MTDAPVPAGTYAIRCHWLCKRYAEAHAACGVSLAVPAGHFAALLGPSGCGKTTVLRMLAGLETPDHGTIELDGRTVSGPGTWVPPEARRIGMVFQEYALFPHLDVRQNIAFGLRRHPDPARRVDEVLRLVDLEAVADRWPHALSGGQQQRVALARALAPGPDVILLDEPFSNLDAALRQRVRAEIRAILRQAGVTAVFVTHDQEEALSLADRVAVMIEGRIMQEGPPEELYCFPANRTVATFLGETNFLDGQAAGTTATCELGTIPLHQTANGRVAIMIRPEAIDVAPAPDGPAIVIDHDYLGHSRMLRVRLPSGGTVKARLSGAAPAPTDGQRVALRVTGAAMAYTGG